MNEFGDALNKICDTSVVWCQQSVSDLPCCEFSKKNWTIEPTSFSGGSTKMYASVSGMTFRMVVGCVTICQQLKRYMTILQFHLRSSTSSKMRMKNRIFAEVSHEDDFCIVLIIAAVCIDLSAMWYPKVLQENQRKRYQESRSCKKEQTLARKAVKRFKTKPKNNPESEDEFNNKGAYETPFWRKRNIDSLTKQKTKLMNWQIKYGSWMKSHSVTYRVVSFLLLGLIRCTFITLQLPDWCKPKREK